MNYTIDYLIERRKIKWQEDHNLERDLIFRETVAVEIIQQPMLLTEVKTSPEKLIELFFVIVDKDKKTVPYFFNEVQEDFISKLKKAIIDYENGLITDISFLILKGRQQGFTTLITAYQLASTIINRNFEGYTLADVTDNAESIFLTKAKFMYNQLPEVLKPTEKYNTKRQLIFEKLNSSWGADSATENVGRSKTINFFHGSEAAFWKVPISSIQSGLGEALTKGAIKIYESTANGFNDFKKMWDSGTHINCFYEWYKTKEYMLYFESESTREEFINNINTQNDWIFTRLKWLLEEKALRLEQLYWYYKKYLNYIDKDIIKQEYPCTPEEAFLSSGQCVFSVENVTQQLDKVRTKLNPTIGYFNYDYDGLKITNIKWIDDPNGYIKIYEKPSNSKYAIGGDTAGEGSDYLTAQVVDVKSGKQVATLKNHMDEDLYAKQIYCLGTYYQDALVGIETNFSTYSIIELERLGYKNQYVREREDTYTHKLVKAFGFRTTPLTRPLIIMKLIELVRDHIEIFNDEETLEEMLKFIKNDKGRPEAQSGAHDDLIMALAIAHYIKAQVIIREEPIITPFKYNFESEKPKSKDWGDTIKVI